MNTMMFFFILTAAVIGIPVPEDVALLTIAIQIERGIISLPIAVGVCWGVLVFSDTLQFTIGKMFGKPIVAFLKKKGRLNDKRKTKLEEQLSRWGIIACFIARFIPGGRIPMFVLAGNSGINLFAFLMVDIVSTAISVSFWLLGGHYIYDLIKIYFHF